MSTTILSEKQTLLASLSAALADLDRTGLGKVVNFVAALAWPSQKKELVRGLLIAELAIEQQHEPLAETCREEMQQERREAEARQKEERERAEKRAETSAKQSAAARLRHEIEAQVMKTGKSAPPPSQPFTPRDHDPNTEH